MAIAGNQIRPGQPKGDSNRRTFTYLYWGSSLSDIEVLDHMELNRPLSYDGMPRAVPFVTGLRRLKDGGTEYIEATSNYQRQEVDRETEEGTAEFAFDFSLRNQKVQKSLSTVNSYVASGIAPDHNQAVNVQPDGKIEGADVLFPASTFTLTFENDTAFFSDAYLLAVEGLIGKVNSAAYRGRPAGSLLFSGARGSVKSEGRTALAYSFAYSPNATGLTIGSIGSIAKDGWDYLWVLWKPQADATAKTIVREPQAVYVERMYERDDFFSVLKV